MMTLPPSPSPAPPVPPLYPSTATTRMTRRRASLLRSTRQVRAAPPTVFTCPPPARPLALPSPSSVSLPFLPLHSPTLCGISARTVYYVLVIPLLLVIFVLLPFIMVLIFYLSFSEVLLPIVLALCFPTMLYHVIWRGYLRVNPTPFAPTATAADRAWLFFLKVHRTWQQEVYQLLLTLLSCCSFIVYTYNLSYVPSTATPPIPGSYDYELDLDDADQFIQLEYFLIVSFSIDYLIGFFVARHKWRHVLSYYGIIDLACFIGVSYFSFFHRGFAPQDAIYNYYLLQGPLRFMRMRRALKGLDHLVLANGRTPVLYRWGEFTLSKQSAMLALVSFRLFLYLMSTAALVLAVEFPCKYVASNPEQCTGVLQRFHLCVYFVVISISTVGYGDVVCVTDLGRMLMIFVVIGALVQVPAELDAWKEVQRASRAVEVGEGENEDEQRRIAGNSTLASAIATPRTASKAVKEEVDEEQRRRWLQWCEQRLLELHSEEFVRLLCEAAGMKSTTKEEVSG